VTSHRPATIAWQPQAPADLRERITEPWRADVAQILVQLKRDPKLGDWLGGDARTGDLSDCRKMKFGPDRGRGPVYRLVYRLLPDNYAPTQVEIVAIGSKADLEAYALAAARLGRQP
jgi:hypothetical protein